MSNIHDFMQVANQAKFERDCLIGEGNTEPYLISIAISLKRIADAMEANARGTFNYFPPAELQAVGDGVSAF